ncbi:MAG: VWA domain-containing protein [Parcubacteria group bacterium]|nr:VWA domain-containing protein [Parcubacteria group bacterium]
MNISFGYDAYIPFVISISAIIFILYCVTVIRIKNFYAQFGGTTQLKKRGNIRSPSLLILRGISITLSVLCILLALLEPRREERTRVYETEPLDIQFVIDCSLSMLAEDARLAEIPQPLSRLEAVKIQIEKFVENFARSVETKGENRLGLVIFADMGIRLIPIPTKNYERFLMELHRLTPAYIQNEMYQGTNIWDGISEALKNCEIGNKKTHKIIIVLTDGEQQSENKYIEEIKEDVLKYLSDENARFIAFYIIGIGDPLKDALIPKTRSARGEVTEYYVQTTGLDAGQFIWTRTQPAYLESIARYINGAYHHSRSINDLLYILDDILKKERIVIRAKIVPSFHSLTHYFILCGLVFFIVTIIIKI